MKCFYEVLEVSRDVSADDLKKTYKKLALKWHPDKNPDNIEEAKEQFQLIQQAYEVLGDPRERQWYDNHREYIINSAGDTPVNELNLFKYFSPSCYKGFGDDDNGFYSVYREVFSTILLEESVYFDVDPDEIPTFGRSNSDYTDIVRTFYNFWCGFSTHKPFGWLDEYDIRQAPNRRVAKLMEKENKKIRDKAKKERNDEIQALVEFVRKRDKRVKAYAETLKLKSAENTKRMEEARKKRIKEKQKELANYKESDWSKFSNVEAELKVIEDSLIAEYGSSDEVDSDDDTANCLYCVACNKVFKTEKAFQNHEKSKKHKENIELIKFEMLNDEQLLNNEEPVENNSSSDDNVHSHSSDENDQDKVNCDSSNNSDEDSCSSNSENEAVTKNKNKFKATVGFNIQNEIDSDSDSEVESDLSSEKEIMNTRKKTIKKKKKESLTIDEVNVLYCLTCDQSFKTEKALHNHQTSKRHRDNVILISAKKTEDDDHDPISNICDDNGTKNNLVLDEVTDEIPKENQPQEEPTTQKSTKNKKKPKIVENAKIKKSNHACGVCAAVFSSKNKLHQHLKDSNHAVLKTVNINERKCKKKNKQ